MLHQLITYLREAQAELKKVVWPTRHETIRATLAVILMSFSVAAFLGGLDAVFTFVIDLLVSSS